MELVVELHLCRGLPLERVAEVLGVKLPVVRKLWRQDRAGIAGEVRTPESKAEFAALREEVGMALWQTVAATFPGQMPEASGEARKRRVPMMRVRIEALRQIATLYDVNPKAKADACRAVACLTPGEIADLVRERRGG
jgi:hypothetical protein